MVKNSKKHYSKQVLKELEEKDLIIIKQELELTDLRICEEKKDEIIESLNKHIDSLMLHLESKGETIEILRDIIYKKFGIKYIKTPDLPKELQEPNIEKIKELVETVRKQQVFVDQYRNSVAYPLYRFSHSFGKTKIGQILQKLIK